MTKYSLLSLFIFILGSFASAQHSTKEAFEVQVEWTNPDSEINNGTAKVIVKGGTAPYLYKWSNVETPLASDESPGLIEGMKHSVLVTDAEGNSVSKTFKIPAESITEIFNSGVQPAVDVLGAVLFWDAFASIGFYDPSSLRLTQRCFITTNK